MTKPELTMPSSRIATTFWRRVLGRGIYETVLGRYKPINHLRFWQQFDAVFSRDSPAYNKSTRSNVPVEDKRVDATITNPTTPAVGSRILDRLLEPYRQVRFTQQFHELFGGDFTNTHNHWERTVWYRVQLDLVVGAIEEQYTRVDTAYTRLIQALLVSGVNSVVNPPSRIGVIAGQHSLTLGAPRKVFRMSALQNMVTPLFDAYRIMKKQGDNEPVIDSIVSNFRFLGATSDRFESREQIDREAKAQEQLSRAVTSWVNAWERDPERRAGPWAPLHVSVSGPSAVTVFAAKLALGSNLHRYGLDLKSASNILSDILGRLGTNETDSKIEVVVQHLVDLLKEVIEKLSGAQNMNNFTSDTYSHFSGGLEYLPRSWVIRRTRLQRGTSNAYEKDVKFDTEGDRAKFSHVRFSNFTCSSLTLDNLDFTYGNIHDAVIKNLTISRSNLAEASISWVAADNFWAEDSHLRNVVFGSCTFNSMLLKNIDVSGANLSNVDCGSLMFDRVIWSDETKWPSFLLETMRRASVQIAEGVYLATDGNSRDAYLKSIV